MRRRSWLFILLGCLLPPGEVSANWTASGVFRYMDRAFNQDGFTGLEAPVPVRFADVEIVDANASPSNAVIASGATDAFGSFVIAVVDSKVRTVYARVITRSQRTPTLHVDVRTSMAQQAIYYAAATTTVGAHNPAVNVNFGEATIQIGQGGEAFNIYDQLVAGADYAAFLTGARPTAQLKTIWGLSNGLGDSTYSVGTSAIMLRDTAGYDDTVVLHEMGHFIVNIYSNVDSPGGSHTFAFCNIDIRLAFDEGWATFWGNSVLRHLGRPLSNIYTRTNGGPGVGHLVRSADLESDSQYLCRGATSEVSVFTILWDIVDGPSTPDLTTGTDDAHDLLDLDDAEVWEVMTDHLPGAANVSLEDFWDGWFLPPALNGFLAEMTDIAGYVGVDYSEDLHEVNDSIAGATPVTAGFPPLQATFFRDPDQNGAGSLDDDYYSFQAEAGVIYVIETMNLVSDGNTKLYLIDSDGSTVLAINDNRASGDDSSRIEWTAPRADTFFVKAFHGPDWGIYGSYDFRVSPLNSVDGDADGFIASVDCDDTDFAVNPGAAETCNGADDNCNSIVDEGFDADFDGTTSCAGDCIDTNPGVHPGAAEIPANSLDDNCNGIVDEASGGRQERERVFHRLGDPDP